MLQMDPGVTEEWIFSSNPTAGMPVNSAEIFTNSVITYIPRIVQFYSPDTLLINWALIGS